VQARFELRQTSVSVVDSHSSYLCSIIRVTVELDNAVLSISPRSVVNMVRKYIQLHTACSYFSFDDTSDNPSRVVDISEHSRDCDGYEAVHKLFQSSQYCCELLLWVNDV